LPNFLFNLLAFNLIESGIFGILEMPSVNNLKYNPVPPTKIGVFFLFKIFFKLNLTFLNHSPAEKLFFTETFP